MNERMHERKRERARERCLKKVRDSERQNVQQQQQHQVRGQHLLLLLLLRSFICSGRCEEERTHARALMNLFQSLRTQQLHCTSLPLLLLSLLPLQLRLLLCTGSLRKWIRNASGQPPLQQVNLRKENEFPGMNAGGLNLARGSCVVEHLAHIPMLSLPHAGFIFGRLPSLKSEAAI